MINGMGRGGELGVLKKFPGSRKIEEFISLGPHDLLSIVTHSYMKAEIWSN